MVRSSVLVLCAAGVVLPAYAGMARLRPVTTRTRVVAPDSACVSATDSLIAKVERNYPGVRLELDDPDRLAAWRGRLDSVRHEAPRATGDACLTVLQRVTDWWDDEHLFIWQSPRQDSVSMARARATVARRAVELTAWNGRWSSSGARDPIEGIWYGDGLEVGVIPAPDGDGFEAVVLHSDTSTWEPGMVRARIRPASGASAYRVALSSRQHRPLHLRAHLIAGRTLRMPPFVWGRRAPTDLAARQ